MVVLILFEGLISNSSKLFLKKEKLTLLYRSKKHLDFIRNQTCIISYVEDVQACHIRILSDGGVGLKPSDFEIPMSYKYHRLQHDIGELNFYKKFCINPYEIALYYAKFSPCKRITEDHIKYLIGRKELYARLHQIK